MANFTALLARGRDSLRSLIAAALLGSAGIASAATWHVAADAPDGGDGSSQHPFASLEAVEAASASGDTIVVRAAPLDTHPLDGGIALQPRQRLLGEARTSGRAPRLTNTSRRLDGDAVVLAPGAEVGGLVIEESRRGGIYGRNVPGARVRGNEIAGHNTSCTLGLRIAPIAIPSRFPGIVIPQPAELPNGWAGIMIDSDTGSGDVVIRDNVVRDARCGDGIDVRVSGDARLTARIVRNTVHGLEQGPLWRHYLSVLAIGMQTLDRSRLRAHLADNSQFDIGDREQTTDSEGVFANLAGASRLIADVDRNLFEHGMGGFSANGLELVISSGTAHATMHVRDSTFRNVTGDVLEGLNLGVGSTMEISLERVVAADAIGVPLVQDLIRPLTYSGNEGDCLTMTSAGAGNTTALTVRDSALTACINNGLTINSNAALGSGAVERVAFDIRGSRITGHRRHNLLIANLAPVAELTGRVEDSDLGAGLGVNVRLERLGAVPSQAVLDFGGGPLGSRGGNCLDSAAKHDLEILGLDVSMQNNWWGGNAPPAPERLDVRKGTASITPVAGTRPAHCAR